MGGESVITALLELSFFFSLLCPHLAPTVDQKENNMHQEVNLLQQQLMIRTKVYLTKENCIQIIPVHPWPIPCLATFARTANWTSKSWREMIQLLDMLIPLLDYRRGHSREWEFRLQWANPQYYSNR